MKHLLGALAALFLCAAHASAATVNCGAVNDDAAVQAALSAGGEVILQGNDCKLTQAVMIGVNGTAVDLRTTIVSTANPAFVVTGQDISLQSSMRRRAVWGPGALVQLGSASAALVNVRLTNIQLNGGTCIVLHRGAGLSAADIHCNGNSTTYAVIVRAWDTARFVNLVTEEHKNGFKFEAGAWNFQAANTVLDRLGPNGAAIHLAPGAGANGNIQFTALWASQGKWPLLAEVEHGQSSAVQVIGAKYSNFEDAVPTIIGSGLTHYQHPYEVFTN